MSASPSFGDRLTVVEASQKQANERLDDHDEVLQGIRSHLDGLLKRVDRLTIILTVFLVARGGPEGVAQLVQILSGS